MPGQHRRESNQQLLHPLLQGPTRRQEGPHQAADFDDLVQDRLFHLSSQLDGEAGFRLLEAFLACSGRVLDLPEEVDYRHALRELCGEGEMDVLQRPLLAAEELYQVSVLLVGFLQGPHGLRLVLLHAPQPGVLRWHQAQAPHRLGHLPRGDRVLKQRQGLADGTRELGAREVGVGREGGDLPDLVLQAHLAGGIDEDHGILHPDVVPEELLEQMVRLRQPVASIRHASASGLARLGHEGLAEELGVVADEVLHQLQLFAAQDLQLQTDPVPVLPQGLARELVACRRLCHEGAALHITLR
mmetsp:Transcript_39351/g.94007  ORF Transcript_39351/g.94007 Transcript_39351/m.94007 type:complete len:300 (+) Transcript_39351:691-1590(+)